MVIPSGADLNTLLANMVYQKKPSTKIIDKMLYKMSAKDVFDITKKRPEFISLFGVNNPEIEDKITEYINNMNRERKGAFTFHFIEDSKIRNLISQTLKISDKEIYASDINDKDILIIDDVISRGKTIKEAIDLIKKTFSPRTVTVLTLFSKL